MSRVWSTAEVFSTADRIDELCDIFEQQWLADRRPAIRSFLDHVDESQQGELFLELVLVEVECRQRSGEHPSCAEYLQDFPEFAEIIHTIDFSNSTLLERTLGHVSGESRRTRNSGRVGLDYSNEPILQSIGRYNILGLLGEGSFARVYLGYDEQLQRRVAIKVPIAKRFQQPEYAEIYLAEARTVASLDHPNIVPVYDVGRLDDGPIYIVSKFIEGWSLKAKLVEHRPGPHESAKLLATIAEALHHAHEQRLVHRDVKPANLLIDGATGVPYVADFGLAIRDEPHFYDYRIAGTPAYMSPEQARGEGHRLDGRSDIFSLGIVLYELLTGTRPFRGSSDHELLYQIISADPLPLRELNSDLPLELERICLKALAKRVSDRYATAAEMSDDLRNWEQVQKELETPLRVYHKGLRSFDAGDADFFLELLPGPRDRDGLPESVRFWKARIEATGAEATFSVGLILGPSGCGKSSIAKAALLPRLSSDVVAVYVESSAADMEDRLLRQLRKELPDLPRDQGLVQTLKLLRHREAPKVVIVLDQFEQWLHASRKSSGDELVVALRQCDGRGLQAIILVRDDFSMAVSRFMDELEVPIVQGHNFSTVDFFGVEHAHKVLTRFGQAFGKLPYSPSHFAEEQREFVQRVISGLAEDGKVLPVRLALFADMVKDKPWVTTTLDEVGGADGVGLKFLDDAFTSRTANPDHRVHEAAARAVLKALLPEVGRDIRGHMRSHAELLQASGYQGRPAEFDALLRILDGELRLLTPTDSAGSLSGSSREAGAQYYQLTHDYLVPVLREWLTRRQRETRRGRAEIRLAERAAIWNMKRERRHLPSMWEHFWIGMLTSQKNRTEPEQRMMAAAARFHGYRAAAACLLLFALVAGVITVGNQIVKEQNAAKAHGRVDQLLVADIVEVPEIVASLGDELDIIGSRLAAIADDTQSSHAERVRATLPLVDRPGPRAESLIAFARSSDLATFSIIRSRVSPFASQLKDGLWATMQSDDLMPSARLRLAAMLSLADPRGNAWKDSAPSVVDALLGEKSLDLDTWVEMLRPISPLLIPELQARLLDQATTSGGRKAAARVLARYADAELLETLLLDSNATQFSVLIAGASQHRSDIIESMRRRVRPQGRQSAAIARPQTAAQLRNAAMTLFRLQQAEDVERLMSLAEDSTTRTMLILEMRDFGVSLDTLLHTLAEWRDPVARQGLLLAMAPYFGPDLTASEERTLQRALEELLQNGEHQAERSAAEWLLGRLGGMKAVDRVAESYPSAPPGTNSRSTRDWWTTQEGHTMVIVRPPAGMNPSEPEVVASGIPPDTSTGPAIYRDFAVSVHEVTISQFRRFQPNASFSLDVANDPHCPANKVSYFDAIRYCRWLSEQEGIPEEEMCYGPDVDAMPPSLPEERLAQTGYRLPTEAEWEYACRAGTATPWFFGVEESHLEAFAWFALNAKGDQRPVGLLRPNAYGLFDTFGNAAEWCHSTGDDDGEYVLRGGAYNSAASKIRSSARHFQRPVGYSYTGFRIARTIRSQR